MLDHSLAVEPHACALPPLYVFGPASPSTGAPSIRRPHPAGTRFHCDGCGLVWVVVDVPPVRGPRVYVVGHPEWRPETRRERRARLGLRWWRRG